MSTDIFAQAPELKNLIKDGDPDALFFNLTQVGHGNFGAVFYAKSKQTDTVVAIKKMQVEKANIEERLSEISNEIKILSELNHDNIVNYLGVYWKTCCVWLVMEYCVGSLVDIMNVSHNPFKEDDISYICYNTLKAINYLHDFGYIHRDIKGANILLTSNGTIKLADFGSTSLKESANTFIGSPYWMAPEVILAMEHGVYRQNSDIWSFGITAIELAETKPPRFEMNSMGALYYIAQNPAPTLTSPGTWSSEFNEFVNACLVKDPDNRPNSETLLKFSFLNKETNNENIRDLINQCVDKIELIDTETYTKVKTLINELSDTDATSDVSATSNEKRESKISARKVKLLKKSSSIGNDEKVKTIRLTHVVAEESFQNENKQPSYDIDEYQLLRKDLNKQVKVAQQKLDIIYSDAIKANDKQLEVMKHDSEKALEKLFQKQLIDYENLLKGQVHAEKKLLKLEMKTSENSLKKKSNNQQSFRKDLILALPERDSNANNIKFSSVFKLRQSQMVERFMMLYSHLFARIKFENDEKLKYNELYLQLYDNIDKIKKDHSEQINNLKAEHLEKIQTAEMKGLSSYFHKLQTQMRKKHINELKQKPKKIKLVENALRKKNLENIKTIMCEYRQNVEKLIASGNKENFLQQKLILKKERAQNLAKADIEFHILVANKTDDIKVSLNSKQKKEKDDLQMKLDSETNQLLESQNSVKEYMKLQIDKIRKALVDEIDNKSLARMNEIINSAADMEKVEVELQKKMDEEKDNLLRDIEAENGIFEKDSTSDYYPISAQDVYAIFSKQNFNKSNIPYN